MTVSKKVIAPIVGAVVGLAAGAAIGAFLMRHHKEKEVAELQAYKETLEDVLRSYVPRVVLDHSDLAEIVKTCQLEKEGGVVFVYDPVSIILKDGKYILEDEEEETDEQKLERWKAFAERNYSDKLSPDDMVAFARAMKDKFDANGDAPIPVSEIEKLLAEFEHPTDDDVDEYLRRRDSYAGGIDSGEDLDDAGYDEHDPDVDGCGVDDDEGDPYLIDAETYNGTKRHYDKIFLTYYEEDNVLCDDQDEIVQDVDRIIGYANIDKGFEDGSKYCYIRSPDVSTDWEIFRHEGSYVEIVLGVPSDEAPKMLKRRFGDDE